MNETGKMVGETLQNGRYKVLRQIGSGRMGAIYVVWDNTRKGELALKCLDQVGEEKLSRILEEFGKVSRITSLELVFLFELFEEEGRWFFTTELLEDGNWLFNSPSKGELSDYEFLRRIFAKLVRGIACLHQRGACHGELSGDDVVIDKDGDLRIYNYGFSIASGVESGVAPIEGVVQDWVLLGKLLVSCLYGTENLSTNPDTFAAENPNVPSDLAQLCLMLLRVESGAIPSPDDVLFVLDPPITVVDEREQSLLESINEQQNQESRVQTAIELVEHYSSKKQYADAYKFVAAEVASLGVIIPSEFSKVQYLVRGWNRLVQSNQSYAKQLWKLPVMQNEKLLMAVKLLKSVLKCAKNFDQRIYESLVFEAVRLFSKHGNPPEAAIFYAIYWFEIRCEAMAGSSLLAEVRESILTLSERSSQESQKPQVHYLVGVYGTCWDSPVLDVEDHMEITCKLATQDCDPELLGHALIGKLINQWLRGVTLDELWEETGNQLPLLDHPNQAEFVRVVQLMRQLISNLQGRTPDPLNLDSDDFNEGDFLGDMLSFENQYLMQFSYLFLACFYMVRDRYTQARIHAFRSRETMDGGKGMWQHAEHHFLEVVVSASDPDWKEEKKLISPALELYQQWTKQEVPHFDIRKKFLYAEDYLINGRIGDAVYAFLEVAEIAKVQKNHFLTALAVNRAMSLDDRQEYKDAARIAWQEYGVSEGALSN